MLDTFSYIIAFLLYLYFEYFIRKHCYPIEPTLSSSFLPKWPKGKEWTFFISPGYWIARYYKDRMKYFPKSRNKHLLRLFIRKNNLYNLIASTLLSSLAFVGFHFIPTQSILTSIIGAFVFLRFISRSFEITYAFSADVMSKTNTSGLRKERRIQLALHSYIELYVISAPVYLAYGIARDFTNSITISLSVGSLTNIGSAFSCPSQTNSDLVFVQVFSTLSLAVLSLAIYISRQK